MQKTPFFSYIDGLRGVAVLAVLAFHLKNSWLPSGFLGVDIFFVISGFVVSHSVHRFQGPFGPFLLEFYRRRVLRIFPPLLACLILTALGAALLIPGVDNHVIFARVSRAAHFAMSNFALIKESANYFSPTADFHPLTHTWSLGIEEQFYLLFPFLFFFLFLSHKNKVRGIFAFLGLFTLSLFLALFMKDQTKAFYSFFPRIWELACGVSAYLLSNQFASQLPTEGKRQNLVPGAALLCLTIVFLSVFQTRGEESFSLWQLAAVIGTGAVLFLLRAPRSETLLPTQILNVKPLRWVGRISYSLYLFHWPVIVLFRWTWGMESSTSLALAGVLSFILGALSFYFIETPMKNFSHLENTISEQKRGTPRRIVACGPIGVFVSLLVTTAIYHFQEKISLSKTGAQAEDWTRGDQFLNPNCPVQTKAISSGATLYYQSSDAQACVVSGKPGTLFVIGDSHASGYSVLFKKIVQNQFSEVQMFTMPGCTTFNMIFANAPCDNFIQESVRSILKVASPNDILFLPGLRVWRLTDYHANPAPNAHVEALLTPEARASREDLRRSAMRLMKPLLDLGIRILLEAPKPLFRISAYRCSDDFNKNNPICRWGFKMNRTELLEYRKPILEALEATTKESSKIQMWDPFPVLCPQNAENVCTPFMGEKPLFFDYDHLSAFGNNAVYDDLVFALKRLASP
ncbi:MAG: acyltransferase [Bdellovibrionales bacterium]|nr:acyltransferase [Bdellovibrionales bacterium]